MNNDPTPAPRPTGGVSRHLTTWAAEAPARIAVVAPDGRKLRFDELEAKVERVADGLTRAGLGPGDSTLLFVPPGIELIALTHALFRIGAVPVLIDPGMGREALLACVERTAPRAMLGIPKAHVARLLFPRAFRSVELPVTVGRRLGWNGPTLAELEANATTRATGQTAGARAAGAQAPGDLAAILFTSGSTGPPKGVVYTHGIFEAQLEALASLYSLQPGEVDVACFPLFALFDNALGMTSVFPEMDASRPGRCDPAKIHATLEANAATFTFGSPAIWTRVHAWAAKHGKRFSTLQRLTIAGAPVSPRLLAGLRELLPPGGEVHTPYGATEALPVANLSGADLVAGVDARSESGEGTCVGRPAPGIDVRIVPITDERLSTMPEPVLRGRVGEICVRGPVVTPAYHGDDEATGLAKVQDPTPEEPGRFWHRMGDVGRFDADGRLWFLGRKSHRLETTDGPVFPVGIENVCNTFEGVRRSALVGLGPGGSERPCLIVEAEERTAKRQLAEQLRRPATQQTLGIEIEHVLFKRSFPVDVRHNAKIKRGQLKRWAEDRAR